MPAPAGSPDMRLAGRTPAVNADSGDFYKATRATLDGAWVRPRHDGYMAFQQAAADRLGAALAAGEPAAAVIDDLNRLFRDSFKGGSSATGNVNQNA